MKTLTTASTAQSHSAQRSLTARLLARTVSLLSLTGILACAAMSISAPAASAATLHAYSTQFGTKGSAAGQLSAPTAVAANAKTHDVYVADPGNHRVDEFTASGAFVLAFGDAVGPVAADVCTGGALSPCTAGKAGAGPGQFEGPDFVAVDNSTGESKGDVYVADSASGRVEKFTEGGVFLSSNSGPEEAPFGAIDGVTVDPAGDLYVLTSFGAVLEYEPGGTLARSFVAVGPDAAGLGVNELGNVYLKVGDGEVREVEGDGTVVAEITPKELVVRPSGLAFDPVGDELYVDFGQAISQLECVPGAGCKATESFGAPHLTAASGLGVDSGDASVFAADPSVDRVVVFAATLEAVTDAASAPTTSTATLHGSVDPEGGALTECFFLYGEDLKAPCVETVGAVSESVSVSAEVTHLTGGTSYHFHLVTRSAAGVLSGGEQQLVTSTIASIDGAAAQELTGSSAVLTARVNPHGMAVTGCRFQYGTSSSYEYTVPCAQSEEQIGAGEEPVPVSARIPAAGMPELKADMTYHWRLVVEDENGHGETASVTPDHTFRYTTVAEPLPDNRRYELVTPAKKNGALIGDGVIFVAPKVLEDPVSHGLRVVTTSLQCFGGTESCNGVAHVEGAPYEFKRTASGWVTVALAPSSSAHAYVEPWYFGADEGTGLFGVPVPGQGPDGEWIARQSDGSFQPIGPMVEPGLIAAPASEGQFATDDLSHMVYSSSKSLWPSLYPSKAGSVYEYVGTGNSEPILVGVSGGAGSHEPISTCKTLLGGRNGLVNEQGSFSGDGRTVYFTAAPASVCNEAASDVPVEELFARIDQSRTEAISEPQALTQGPREECKSAACVANTEKTTPDNPSWRDGNFTGASGDGSRVFFTSTQQLTDTATQDPAAGDSAFHDSGAQSGCEAAHTSGCNLYESECPDHCEGPGAKRSLIDVSAGDSSGGGPRVQGTVAVSEDGSHVYFIAKGVLTTEANPEGKVAFPGEENLYVFQHEPGVADHLAFVGRVTETDAGYLLVEGGVRANTTPDGRYLVFTSHRALTGDDTRVEGPRQVFRYDAQTPALTRISVGEEGFNDDGNAGSADASIVPAYRGAGSPSRSDPTMSDDGSYVFFSSAVGLTRGALNDVPNGINVYEWHEGQVSLISDGREAVESGHNIAPTELIGASRSGADVFFATGDQLVPKDIDSQRDYYDAHSCSETSPCTSQVVEEPAACLEEACHGAGSPANTAGAPASSVLGGSGNLASLGAVVKPKVKPLSAAQLRAKRLARALKHCHKDRQKRQRAKCEKTAHRLYGAASSVKRSSHTTHRRSK